jgi:hypothetical protein
VKPTAQKQQRDKPRKENAWHIVAATTTSARLFLQGIKAFGVPSAPIGAAGSAKSAKRQRFADILGQRDRFFCLRHKTPAAYAAGVFMFMRLFALPKRNNR